MKFGIESTFLIFVLLLLTSSFICEIEAKKKKDQTKKIDYYERLGVKRDASFKQIKKA